jgi:hypothetical protein
MTHPGVIIKELRRFCRHAIRSPSMLVESLVSKVEARWSV